MLDRPILNHARAPMQVAPTRGRAGPAETSLYTERERAALAWPEAVTLVADGHVPDDVYAEVSSHFTEQEVVAGDYRPGMFKHLPNTVPRSPFVGAL